MNLVAPAYYFQGGVIWLECLHGKPAITPNGPAGRLCSLFEGDTLTPVMFSPRLLHATLPWTGGQDCGYWARAVLQAHGRTT